MGNKVKNYNLYRFEDFYERMIENGKTLLHKMQALETYPPYHETPLLGENSEKEYQHAKEHMQNSIGHRKIGTLSQSEWEAISKSFIKHGYKISKNMFFFITFLFTAIYNVFAFQKAKTIWNAEGKPEFVKS